MNFPGMRCPYCQTWKQNEVLETRAFETYIRRRRKCKACNKRWTTRETVQERKSLIRGSNK